MKSETSSLVPRPSSLVVHIVCCVTMLISVFAAGDAFAAITLDGYLHNDWGVTPAGYGSSDWTPKSGVYYTTDDDSGLGAGFVNPGFGGQTFDAEAMYYTRENGMIYLAIVTGFPRHGADGYIPGDIGIDLGFDGVYEYAVKTYGSSRGYFYKNLTGSSWNMGEWGSASDPTTKKLGAGTYVGTTTFFYQHSYYDPTYIDKTNDHWVMELGIPESYFGSDWSNGGRIHWTQSCGNDVLNLNVPPIPEPASLLLIGLGLAAFAGLRRR